MQTIPFGTHPKIALAVLKDGPYLIIDKALGVVRVMFESSKGASIAVKAV